MATVWTKRLPKERTQTGTYQDTYEFVEVWLVRVDDPETAINDITNATGINYLDAHPADASCRALSFSTSSADDSGMLWKVSITFKQPPVNNADNGEDQPPGLVNFMKLPIYSASSSVVTVPAVRYYDGESNFAQKIITNSAGDPIEGLEKEEAEHRLTLKTYHPSHTGQYGWAIPAREYTNAINSDSWNGGAPETWKCQGCSAQVISENSSGVTLIAWEVTWEFAYRESTWSLFPWDVGFSERVNEQGEPSQSGTKRRNITGQDGKAARQPVALQNGMALPPGEGPYVINDGAGVRVYRIKPFGIQAGGPFIELYTPAAANT